MSKKSYLQEKAKAMKLYLNLLNGRVAACNSSHGWN